MHVWIMLKSIECFNPLHYAPTTSKNDKNEYQLGTLHNGMIVLLVRDSSLTKTNFCLGLEAGSRDDPAEIEGVAHLTEHLMSRSSPLDNIWNDGLLAEQLFQLSYNSMFVTNRCHTTYRLHTANKDIGMVVNMMVMAMAAPLFQLADTALEIASINTEFQLRTNHTSVISMGLLTGLHAPGGYILRDGCGNMRTLGHPDTAKSVRRFWQENYYGQKMSLVIFSSLSFEEMRAVADKFEWIRSNPKIKRANARPCEYDREKAHSRLASFRPVKDLKLKANMLQYIYRTKSTGHVSVINIRVILPSFRKYDQFVPFKLIKEYINCHLYTYGMSRLNDLGCSVPVSACIFDYTDYAMLDIELVLTTRGIANYKEVLDAVLETLRSMDLSDDYFAPWVKKKKALFDRTTNKYTDDLISSMSTEALFSHPSDILSGAYLYKAEKIDKQLIRKLLSYIADFNNWIVVIMDKDYKPGKRDLHGSLEATYYERERKPRYFPESQYCVYALPGGKDTPQTQCHSWLQYISYRLSGLIKQANSLWPLVGRQYRSWSISFEGNLEYACLYLLLLELARLEAQAAQAAENRSIDDEVFITYGVGTDLSECRFVVYFSTDSSEDVLWKTVLKYIMTAKNPGISSSFEIAKAYVLYHRLIQSPTLIMSKRQEFFLNGHGIDLLAQMEAISSLRNEEIVGMSILGNTCSSSIEALGGNRCNIELTLSRISLPNYLDRCNLSECTTKDLHLRVCGPICDTVACSYFLYEIHNTYIHLCRISGSKPQERNIEEPLCCMYDAFICSLIMRLLKRAFIIKVAKTKLHAYRSCISAEYSPISNAVCICYSVPSKSPMEDHLKTIDAFVASGGAVIAEISPNLFNHVFQTLIDDMQFEMLFERYIKELARVKSGQTEIDDEIQKQKNQLGQLVTQKNLVAIYSRVLIHGRKLFIPSGQSEICA